MLVVDLVHRYHRWIVVGCHPPLKGGTVFSRTMKASPMGRDILVSSKLGVSGPFLICTVLVDGFVHYVFRCRFVFSNIWVQLLG